MKRNQTIKLVFSSFSVFLSFQALRVTFTWFEIRMFHFFFNFSACLWKSFVWKCSINISQMMQSNATHHLSNNILFWVRWGKSKMYFLWEKITTHSGIKLCLRDTQVNIAWLSLCFILETSWVALYSVVCEWVSMSGISVTRPNLHFFQYIQAYKPFADPIQYIKA